ncbi:hypothetical protein pdam_00016303, partial [Pocillopora damicornis]
MKICKIIIDVPLTNQPDLFVRGGVFDPALSDRMLIYGIVKEKVRKDSLNQVQVRNALESLNTRKASGRDNLPARVLRYGAEKLAIPLAELSTNNCPSSVFEQLPSDQISKQFDNRLDPRITA